MADRVFHSIAELPRVGGALCLDFVNTTGARSSAEPRERLRSYSDFLVFCRNAKLLDARQAESLRRTAARKPAAARSLLRRALEIREALHGILSAVAGDSSPPAADLDLFNDALAEATCCRQLLWVRGQPRWIWAAEPDDLKQPLPRILHSAAELLEAPDESPIKKCGACDWLFLDTSRNQRRRWCKAACGDRVKSHRYYHRHKRNDKGRVRHGRTMG